jgi:DNA repair exonuclease SbcCD ATPase subunit
LKAEADAAEAVEKELESQLEEQTARADQLQQQLDKLAIPDLSSEMRAQAVAEADKKFVQMQAEYDVMKKRFELLDKDAVKNVQDLEDAKQKAIEEAERLRDQNARLKTQGVEREQYIDGINKQLEAVQTRIVAIEKEQRVLIEEHRKAIDAMNAQLREKEAAIESAKLEAQTQIAAADARADAAEMVARQLEEKMDDLKKQVENLTRVNQIKSDYITSLREFYKQMKNTAEANAVFSERKAAAKEIQTKAAARRSELDPNKTVLGQGESFWGGDSKRSSYHGGRQSYYGGDDDSLRYTAVGVAGVAGAAAWFGFSGLLIFLLVMLIVWFAYHIYSEQFVKKIHHRPRHCQARRLIS